GTDDSSRQPARGVALTGPGILPLVRKPGAVGPGLLESALQAEKPYAENRPGSPRYGEIGRPCRNLLAPARGEREPAPGCPKAGRQPLSPFHALDQDAGRLRPHHPRVGQLARPQLLAQLPAADRHLLVTLGRTLVDQADAAQLLVERREADLHRLDFQVALEF